MADQLEKNMSGTAKKDMHRQIIEYSFETTVIHSNHNILYINEAGANFFRAKKEGLIGANVVEVFTEEYRKFIVERIWRGEKENQVGELVETSVYRTDGTRVEVELFCHPVMYGDTPAMQSIIRDITPRKQAERELFRLMTPIVPVTCEKGDSDPPACRGYQCGQSRTAIG